MATSFPASEAYTTPPNSHGGPQAPSQSLGYIPGAQHSQGLPQALPQAAPQFSPINSASATPMDQSPSSPRNPAVFPILPLATRQLRPPKSPMYIPAALRPTEKPPRPAPLTPPRSVHGSTESLDGSQPSRPLSRRSATSINKQKAISRTTEAADDDLPPITSLPTREHWKPDADALICDAPTCSKAFSLFERRHHCRHCGFVFCNTHSAHAVPLNQNAEFHPRGARSRACKYCWDRYREWKAAQVETRNNSLDSESTTTPTEGMPTGFVGVRGKSADGGKGLATSAPRDWSWSTF